MLLQIVRHYKKKWRKVYKLKLTEARSIDSTEGFTDDIISDTFTDFRKFG